MCRRATELGMQMKVIEELLDPHWSGDAESTIKNLIIHATNEEDIARDEIFHVTKAGQTFTRESITNGHVRRLAHSLQGYIHDGLVRDGYRVFKWPSFREYMNKLLILMEIRDLRKEAGTWGE